jgi:hypothetical protein
MMQGSAGGTCRRGDIPATDALRELFLRIDGLITVDEAAEAETPGREHLFS